MRRYIPQLRTLRVRPRSPFETGLSRGFGKALGPLIYAGSWRPFLLPQIARHPRLMSHTFTVVLIKLASTSAQHMKPRLFSDRVPTLVLRLMFEALQPILSRLTIREIPLDQELATGRTVLPKVFRRMATSAPRLRRPICLLHHHILPHARC
jgi:hypothetical protein